MDKYQEVKEILSKAKNVVFFTGAGISTHSGIKDFRSKDGLYYVQSKYNEDYETMLSRTYFLSHYHTFYCFYKEVMVHQEAKFNQAHALIKKYQDQHPSCKIITQNIDGLDEQAGSKDVIELHGSIKRNYCMKCHKFYSLKEYLSFDFYPKCSCGGLIKPDVVLYEEPLNEKMTNKALNHIVNADCLIIIGTSLKVYPAAGFISYFQGKHLIVINNDDTYIDSSAEYVFHEDIISCLNKIID